MWRMLLCWPLFDAPLATHPSYPCTRHTPLATTHCTPTPTPTPQVKLSPFSLEDLCVAVASGAPSSLADEVHLCVLRALALYETPDQRALRRLPLELLDHASWPEYVWEYLELCGDKDLLGARWGGAGAVVVGCRG